MSCGGKCPTWRQLVKSICYPTPRWNISWLASPPPRHTEYRWQPSPLQAVAQLPQQPSPPESLQVCSIHSGHKWVSVAGFQRGRCTASWRGFTIYLWVTVCVSILSTHTFVCDEFVWLDRIQAALIISVEELQMAKWRNCRAERGHETFKEGNWRREQIEEQ